VVRYLELGDEIGEAVVQEGKQVEKQIAVDPHHLEFFRI
jgi:hypothetical protein